MKSNTTDRDRLQWLRQFSINSIKRPNPDRGGKAESVPEVVGDIRPIPAGHSPLSFSSKQLSFPWWDSLIKRK